MKLISKASQYFFLYWQQLLTVNRTNLDFLFIRVYLIILISTNFFIWLFAYYINLLANKKLIALSYNVDFGINLIGSSQNIYLIPLIGIIIILINYFLTTIFHRSKNYKFIAHILLLAAVITQLLFLLVLAIVYLINFKT